MDDPDYTDTLMPESAPPQSATPRLAKPPHGSPCNYCGLCCLKSTCNTGQKFFGIDKKTRCPALEWNDHGAQCGLMANPAKYAPGLVKVHGAKRMGDAARVIIGSGTGCDANYDDEPKNAAFQRRMDLRRKTLARKIDQALKMWGRRGRSTKR
jgi:hypothetical protein